MRLRNDAAADRSEYNQVTMPSLPDIVSNTPTGDTQQQLTGLKEVPLKFTLHERKSEVTPMKGIKERKVLQKTASLSIFNTNEKDFAKQKGAETLERKRQASID